MVAVGVVDELEVVDVDYHHGDRVTGQQRVGADVAEVAMEGPAVEQAGQFVDDGLTARVTAASVRYWAARAMQPRSAR